MKIIQAPKYRNTDVPAERLYHAPPNTEIQTFQRNVSTTPPQIQKYRRSGGTSLPPPPKYRNTDVPAERLYHLPPCRTIVKRQKNIDPQSRQ